MYCVLYVFLFIYYNTVFLLSNPDSDTYGREALSRVWAIEAIEATRLPAITPGPCTRAPAV